MMPQQHVEGVRNTERVRNHVGNLRQPLVQSPLKSTETHLPQITVDLDRSSETTKPGVPIVELGHPVRTVNGQSKSSECGGQEKPGIAAPTQPTEEEEWTVKVRIILYYVRLGVDQLISWG